jgi:hypothetical protein
MFGLSDYHVKPVPSVAVTVSKDAGYLFGMQDGLTYRSTLCESMMAGQPTGSYRFLWHRCGLTGCLTPSSISFSSSNRTTACVTTLENDAG